MTNIENLKNEIIKQLEEEIFKKQSQVELIKTIDVTKPITEKVWHQLCETPFRNSELLSNIVQAIWPAAENIQIHANYVWFKLDKFNIAIPTSRSMGIEIDVNWFNQLAIPRRDSYISNENIKMKKYFELIDDPNSNWYDIYKYKVPKSLNHYKKWVCWLIWNFKYKYIKIDKDYWNSKFAKEEEMFNNRLQNYYNNQYKIYQLCNNLFTIVIPKLQIFSTNIRIYNNNRYFNNVELTDIYDFYKQYKEGETIC